LTPRSPAALDAAQKPARDEGASEQRRNQLVEERFTERARKFVLLAETGFARVGVFVHWESLAQKEEPRQGKPEREKTSPPKPPRSPRSGWRKAKRAALVLTVVLTVFQINNEALEALNAGPDDAQTGGVTQDGGGIYFEEGGVKVVQEVEEQ
jgi:hypothetical protein